MAAQHPPLLLLQALLRPVARFCLRHSIHIQDIIETVKRVFIEEASAELANTQEKANISRLSVLTGLHRRDCMRLTAETRRTQEPQGLIHRIIGQWQLDKRFSSSAGRPRKLTFDGDSSQFHELCSTISLDLNPGTVLFELERLGAVERSGKNLVLRKNSFVPRKRDLSANLPLLAGDVEDLVRAIEENLFGSGAPQHLHAKTAFDNIDPEGLEKIRNWIFEEGERFHARARELFAKYDRDITPRRSHGRASSDAPAGRRVALGTFSFIS